MCVFLISPVPIAEPLTSELIDTPVFYNLAPRPIKYRVSVPIPTNSISLFYRSSFGWCTSLICLAPGAQAKLPCVSEKSRLMWMQKIHRFHVLI